MRVYGAQIRINHVLCFQTNRTFSWLFWSPAGLRRAARGTRICEICLLHGILGCLSGHKWVIMVVVLLMAWHLFCARASTPSWWHGPISACQGSKYPKCLTCRTFKIPHFLKIRLHVIKLENLQTYTISTSNFICPRPLVMEYVSPCNVIPMVRYQLHSIPHELHEIIKEVGICFIEGWHPILLLLGSLWYDTDVLLSFTGLIIAKWDKIMIS